MKLNFVGILFVCVCVCVCVCVSVFLALPVGCRANNSRRCYDGLCLPPTVTCDGKQYCSDGSTFDLLCGAFRLQ